MGKEYRGKKQQAEAPLEQRPFRKLKGFKVGPLCLACGEPIDLRRTNGHGWVHGRCEGSYVPAEPRVVIAKNGQRVRMVGKDGKPTSLPGRAEPAFTYKVEGTDDIALYLQEV